MPELNEARDQDTWYQVWNTPYGREWIEGMNQNRTASLLLRSRQNREERQRRRRSHFEKIEKTIQNPRVRGAVKRILTELRDPEAAIRFNHTVPIDDDGFTLSDHDTVRHLFTEQYIRKQFDCDRPAIAPSEIPEELHGIYHDGIHPKTNPHTSFATFMEGKPIRTTADERRRTIASLKKNGAPGNSGHPYSLLVNANSEFQSYIWELVDNVIETGEIPERWCLGIVAPTPKPGKPATYTNMRPITLLETIYKMASHVIALRCGEFAKENTRQKNGFGCDLFHAMQFAFQAERGCHDVLHMFNAVLEEARQRGIPIRILSTDLEKAYDRVENWSLLLNMRHQGVPLYIQRFVVNMSKRARSKIATPSGLTDASKMERGIQQGDPLSCIKWLMLIEPLLRWLETVPGITPNDLQTTLKFICYADDMMLVHVGEDRTVFDEMVRRCVVYFSFHNINFQPPKCYYAHARTPTNDPVPHIYGKAVTDLGSEKVFRYLGLWWTANLDWREQERILTHTIGKQMAHLLAAVDAEDVPRSVIPYVIEAAIMPTVEFVTTIANIRPNTLANWATSLHVAEKHMLGLPKSFAWAYLGRSKEEGGLNLDHLEHRIYSTRIVELMVRLCHNNPLIRNIARNQERSLQYQLQLPYSPLERPFIVAPQDNTTILSSIVCHMAKCGICIRNQREAQLDYNHEMDSAHVMDVLHHTWPKTSPHIGVAWKWLRQCGLTTYAHLHSPDGMILHAWSVLHRLAPNPPPANPTASRPPTWFNGLSNLLTAPEDHRRLRYPGTPHKLLSTIDCSLDWRKSLPTEYVSPGGGVWFIAVDQMMFTAGSHRRQNLQVTKPQDPETPSPIPFELYRASGTACVGEDSFTFGTWFVPKDLRHLYPDTNPHRDEVIRHQQSHTTPRRACPACTQHQQQALKQRTRYTDLNYIGEGCIHNRCEFCCVFTPLAEETNMSRCPGHPANAAKHTFINALRPRAYLLNDTEIFVIPSACITERKDEITLHHNDDANLPFHVNMAAKLHVPTDTGTIEKISQRPPCQAVPFRPVPARPGIGRSIRPIITPDDSVATAFGSPEGLPPAIRRQLVLKREEAAYKRANQRRGLDRGTDPIAAKLTFAPNSNADLGPDVMERTDGDQKQGPELFLASDGAGATNEPYIYGLHKLQAYAVTTSLHTIDVTTDDDRKKGRDTKLKVIKSWGGVTPMELQAASSTAPEAQGAEIGQRIWPRKRKHQQIDNQGVIDTCNSIFEAKGFLPVRRRLKLPCRAIYNQIAENFRDPNIMDVKLEKVNSHVSVAEGATPTHAAIDVNTGERRRDAIAEIESRYDQRDPKRQRDDGSQTWDVDMGPLTEMDVVAPPLGTYIRAGNESPDPPSVQEYETSLQQDDEDYIMFCDGQYVPGNIRKAVRRAVKEHLTPTHNRDEYERLAEIHADCLASTCLNGPRHRMVHIARTLAKAWATPEYKINRGPREGQAKALLQHCPCGTVATKVDMDHVMNCQSVLESPWVQNRLSILADEIRQSHGFQNTSPLSVWPTDDSAQAALAALNSDARVSFKRVALFAAEGTVPQSAIEWTYYGDNERTDDAEDRTRSHYIHEHFFWELLETIERLAQAETKLAVEANSTPDKATNGISDDIHKVAMTGMFAMKETIRRLNETFAVAEMLSKESSKLPIWRNPQLCNFMTRHLRLNTEVIFDLTFNADLPFRINASEWDLSCIGAKPYNVDDDWHGHRILAKLPDDDKIIEVMIDQATQAIVHRKDENLPTRIVLMIPLTGTDERRQQALHMAKRGREICTIKDKSFADHHTKCWYATSANDFKSHPTTRDDFNGNVQRVLVVMWENEMAKRDFGTSGKELKQQMNDWILHQAKVNFTKVKQSMEQARIATLQLNDEIAGPQDGHLCICSTCDGRRWNPNRKRSALTKPKFKQVRLEMASKLIKWGSLNTASTSQHAPGQTKVHECMTWPLLAFPIVPLPLSWTSHLSTFGQGLFEFGKQARELKMTPQQQATTSFGTLTTSAVYWLQGETPDTHTRTHPASRRIAARLMELGQTAYGQHRLVINKNPNPTGHSAAGPTAPPAKDVAKVLPTPLRQATVTDALHRIAPPTKRPRSEVVTTIGNDILHATAKQTDSTKTKQSKLTFTQPDNTIPKARMRIMPPEMDPACCLICQHPMPTLKAKEMWLSCDSCKLRAHFGCGVKTAIWEGTLEPAKILQPEPAIGPCCQKDSAGFICRRIGKTQSPNGYSATDHVKFPEGTWIAKHFRGYKNLFLGWVVATDVANPDSMTTVWWEDGDVSTYSKTETCRLFPEWIVTDEMAISVFANETKKLANLWIKELQESWLHPPINDTLHRPGSTGECLYGYTSAESGNVIYEDFLVYHTEGCQDLRPLELRWPNELHVTLKCQHMEVKTRALKEILERIQAHCTDTEADSGAEAEPSAPTGTSKRKPPARNRRQQQKRKTTPMTTPSLSPSPPSSDSEHIPSPSPSDHPPAFMTLNGVPWNGIASNTLVGSKQVENLAPWTTEITHATAIYLCGERYEIQDNISINLGRETGFGHILRLDATTNTLLVAWYYQSSQILPADRLPRTQNEEGRDYGNVVLTSHTSFIPFLSVTRKVSIAFGSKPPDQDTLSCYCFHNFQTNETSALVDENSISQTLKGIVVEELNLKQSRLFKKSKSTSPRLQTPREEWHRIRSDLDSVKRTIWNPKPRDDDKSNDTGVSDR